MQGKGCKVNFAKTKDMVSYFIGCLQGDASKVNVEFNLGDGVRFRGAKNRVVHGSILCNPIQPSPSTG